MQSLLRSWRSGLVDGDGIEPPTSSMSSYRCLKNGQTGLP